ncbi:hypothetical protein KAS50_05500, partial [bacterium]|nr:hypothetical protein [bacterium]
YTRVPEHSRDLSTILPFEPYSQLIKKDYVWKGSGNLTEVVLQQPCPDTRSGGNIYYSNFYGGGIVENNTATNILNWRNDLLYVLSNSTLYEKGGQPAGHLEWKEDSLLVLSNYRDDVVAQWRFGPARLEIRSYSEKNWVLLLGVATKFAFGSFNECTSDYWLTLQMVIISGILSAGSVVAICIIVGNKPSRETYRPQANLRLQSFTTEGE